MIIIFLNAEKFLREAIESVIGQIYRDWELLLVDDGSSDDSTSIAVSYARQYPERVRYLDHEAHQNLGMSAARNLGIRHAAGNLIAFLDADDAWFPNTLQEQTSLLDAHPEAAFVYGPVLYWYGWTGNTDDRQRDYVEDVGVPPNRSIRPPRLLPLFLGNKAAVPSGILIRRDVVERHGGFEEAFRGEYEDQAFLVKICLHEYAFVSERCWYRYRQHPHSAVSTAHQTGQTDPARLFFLKWVESYLHAQGVKNLAIRWALEQEFWRYTHPRLFWETRRWRQREQSLRYWLGGKPRQDGNGAKEAGWKQS